MKSIIIQVLLLIGLTFSANAQRKITGKVTDWEGGYPIEGIGVQVKGTKIKSLTDSIGSYEIILPKGKKYLFFGCGTSAKTKYHVTRIDVRSLSVVDIQLVDVRTKLSHGEYPKSKYKCH